MSVEIRGTVEEIIYKNEDNGYVIAVVDHDDMPVYIKGTIPFISEGESMIFRGHYVVHKTYGEQLEVESCEVITPSSVEDIERYLASGLVRGIGPATAHRIVEKFGDAALDVIQYNPERLTEVAGIGGSKAQVIAESFIDQRVVKNVMLFLQKYGISVVYGMKIYKLYGQEAIRLISENPYCLAEDIDGIGFKKADEIAQKMGVVKASPYRLSSGIKYVLHQYVGSGHTFIGKDQLTLLASEQLGVELATVEGVLSDMIIKGDVFFTTMQGQNVIFPTQLYEAEKGVFTQLLALNDAPYKLIEDNLEKLIESFEEEEGIALDTLQAEAIKHSVQNGVMVITGGPGTGKTTIIKGIIKLFETYNFSLMLAAPTGRAAKRMTEATHRESKTIHRLLEYAFVEGIGQGFNKNQDNPLVTDVVIIDELSMVDIVLMNHLLNAIPLGTRLILVGDADQLPSVGAGNVLGDIIRSEMIYTTWLEEIFRQGQESMIVTNAHRINRGEAPLLNEKNQDFYFIHRKSHKDIVETIRDLCFERLPDYYQVDPIKDIQVLSPMKNSDIGTLNLNRVLQERLNPKSGIKEEKVFPSRTYREGDKVMQVRNNYELSWQLANGTQGKGVYNGDIGLITLIDNKERVLEVLFDDGKRCLYTFDQLDDLILAYAATVHKSQGSEFRVVVMPISYGPPLLLSRNVLYTAITRAKELVVLVGDERYLHEMIRNNNNRERHSALGEFFRMYREELELLT
ncbi:MAG: ATP-dependent RecD-like DNA helicase [Clostridia bacterium]|nr:ATP-dependent RecD-like DNA helicase [Clostridia bacterium]